MNGYRFVADDNTVYGVVAKSLKDACKLFTQYDVSPESIKHIEKVQRKEK